MKSILPGFVVLALVVGGEVERVPVCRAAEHPAAGRQREFQVVTVDPAEMKRRLADAEADVAVCKLRVAWMTRLVQRCFPREMLEAEIALLERARLALDRLRRESQGFPARPRSAVAK